MVYIGQKIRSKNNTQEHLQHLQIYTLFGTGQTLKICQIFSMSFEAAML